MTQATRQIRPAGAPRAPRAEVKLVDLDRRRVAIITDWGYTVADLKEGALRLLDIVEGEMDAIGRSIWTNLSTGLPVSVVITHVQATKAGAQQLVERGASLVRRGPADAV